MDPGATMTKALLLAGVAALSVLSASTVSARAADVPPGFWCSADPPEGSSKNWRYYERGDCFLELKSNGDFIERGTDCKAVGSHDGYQDYRCTTEAGQEEKRFFKWLYAPDTGLLSRCPPSILSAEPPAVAFCSDNKPN